MKNNVLRRYGPFLQRPNAPIVVWAVANLISLAIPQSLVGELANLIALGALILWAFLELIAGSGPFRRVLGTAVLLALLGALIANVMTWR